MIELATSYNVPLSSHGQSAATDEAQAFERLFAEQERVQQDKCRNRNLWEYNSLCVPGWEDWSSAVRDFVAERSVVDETVSLQGLLQGFRNRISDPTQPVSWVDMAAGYALSEREMSMNITESPDPSRFGKQDFTAVDIVPAPIAGYSADFGPELFAELETNYPGITSQQYEPKQVQADVQTVRLERPADLITAVECIQYLDNPVAAIGHWYNSLSDDGVLLVAAEHVWSSMVRYVHESDHPQTEYRKPLKSLLQQLGRHGVSYATTLNVDSARDGREQPMLKHFRTLAIQKRAGTALDVNSVAPPDVHSRIRGYKTVYYPDDLVIPVIG